MRYLCVFCGIFFLECHCFLPSAKISTCEADNSTRIKGLTFVAPPDSFAKDPMPAIKMVNAEWIAVIPYAVTLKGEPSVHYNYFQEQWWGELPSGVAATIRLARSHGLKVMVKPQVYVPNGWTGTLDFGDAAKWAAWEQTYEQYILEIAAIAEREGAELFCIGTEFTVSERERPQFWRNLAAKTRKLYKGKLTYAANWDAYEAISFWDAVDYIGVNAYFPILQQKTPSVALLKEGWVKYAAKLENFYCKNQKPILFTEFGYLSVDGCAYNTWELEGKIRQVSVNEQAQYNALSALFETFWAKDWWAGGFLWKWFPNMEGHEGYLERDYTPQQKVGEKAVEFWYAQE